ncbi:hypothetical protein NCCP1664_25180 [Zafaria cholistanensis]|uniref:Uncharacterized protein n=1 Tax=Zafaria cholistanensis TaxID=1682741 RepID=A0A5A7NTA6_9MICC|nr:hypothetical protein [Zafaria cholistanensis]GER24023.1 hypothetical protein NCCP1664_25180 [Zafaria cholistanensis]
MADTPVPAIMPARRRIRRMQCGDGKGCGAEAGSAVVEFVFLGVLLLVPVVYAILAVSQLQAAAFAAVGAADHAAKVFVAADTEPRARAAAVDAAARAVRNMGLPAGSEDVSVRCSGPCLHPGSRVTVTVTVSVALPLLPAGAGADVGRASASATHRVERFG